MEESKTSDAPVAAESGGDGFLVASRNEKNIPKMVFIDEVGAFLKKHNTTVEEVLRHLRNLHSKYDLMLSSFLRVQLKSAKQKLKEVEDSLNALSLLRKKKEDEEVLRAHVVLADSVFSKAVVEPRGLVSVWLGANIMVELTYDEAFTFFSRKLDNAKTLAKQLQEDIDFTEENKITCQVTIARVFNHDVKVRREAKAAGTST